MQNIIFRLREKYPRLRFCLENLDFEVKDATTLGQAMKQLEAAAKVRKLSQNETQRLAIAKRLRQEGTPDSSLFDLGAYYEGKVAGASPEELLENLTRNTPYSWQKIGESYVVRPRGYTRLDFPVTLETNGLSLDEAIPKLLKQKPTGPEIGYGMIIAMPVTPGVDPFPWLHAKLPPLKLDKMTAMEALCRLSARARADCVWELAGYKDSRMLSVQVGRTPENKP